MVGRPTDMKGETSPTPPKVRIFDCSACGGQVSVKFPGKSLVATCQSCQAIIDVTDERYQVLATLQNERRLLPKIPLGTRGRLKGDIYEVIGYLRKKDGSLVYHWDEYLLFNPYHGFRWLVESDGHWSYVIPIKGIPKTQESRAYYLGKSYKKFTAGRAIVDYVLGEFYWRIKYGDESEVADFIAPPEMLSRETVTHEITWSLGEYIEPEIIKRAFKLNKDLPAPVGIGPCQPVSHKQEAKINKIAIQFLIAAAFIQLVFLAIDENKEALSVSFDHDPTRVSPEYVSEPFDLSGRMTNIESEIKTNLSNHWLGLELSLFREDTGASIDFEQVVEYYFGSDWSEGSTTNQMVISDVAPGRYQLRASNMGDQLTQIKLVIWRDRFLPSNFLVSAILICAYPIILFIRKWLFENARWQKSDFI